MCSVFKFPVEALLTALHQGFFDLIPLFVRAFYIYSIRKRLQFDIAASENV